MTLEQQINDYARQGLLGIGLDDQTAQEYAPYLGLLAQFVPGVGEGVGIDNTRDAVNEGRYGDAAIEGGLTLLGVIPGLGDVAAAAIKGMRKVPDGALRMADEFDEAAWLKANPSRPMQAFDQGYDPRPRTGGQQKKEAKRSSKKRKKASQGQGFKSFGGKKRESRGRAPSGHRVWKRDILLTTKKPLEEKDRREKHQKKLGVERQQLTRSIMSKKQGGIPKRPHILSVPEDRKAC